jgi:hypothetical protein
MGGANRVKVTGSGQPYSLCHRRTGGIAIKLRGLMVSRCSDSATLAWLGSRVTSNDQYLNHLILDPRLREDEYRTLSSPSRTK